MDEDPDWKVGVCEPLGDGVGNGAHVLEPAQD